MSKDLARSAKSYRNEQLVMELAPELLRANGLDATEVRRQGGMKLIDTIDKGGAHATFWLKQGWSESEAYSAIQFGMLPNVRLGAAESDSRFIQHTIGVINRAIDRGATHALLIHMVDGKVRSYLALRIDDLKVAYEKQIGSWPKRARNSKIPTLFFVDRREVPDAACTSVFEHLELDLAAVAESVEQIPPANRAEGRKLTAEVERRLEQRKFRFLVGERFKWKCAVTGVAVREALDAAHLPGKDWRHNNEAEDGILLRVDLHRLMDCGLAKIEGGRFMLAPDLSDSHYSGLHGQELFDAR